MRPSLIANFFPKDNIFYSDHLYSCIRYLSHFCKVELPQKYRRHK